MHADIDLVANILTPGTLAPRRDSHLIGAVDEGEALDAHRRPRSDVRALGTPGESDALPAGEVDECRARHSQHVLLGGHHAARGPPAVSGGEGGPAHHQRVEDTCRERLLSYLTLCMATCSGQLTAHSKHITKTFHLSIKVCHIPDQMEIRIPLFFLSNT